MPKRAAVSSPPGSAPLPRRSRRLAVAPASDKSDYSNMVFGSLKIDDIVIDFKAGDILAEDVNCIAMSTNTDLHTSNGFFEALCKAAGSKSKINDAFDAAKKGVMGVPRPGETVPVFLDATNMPHKCLFLVVDPAKNNLNMAYRSILSKAVDLNMATIAIPCLGCGAKHVSPELSAQKAINAIKDFSTVFTGTNIIQRVVFLDRVSSIIDRFAAVADGIIGAIGNGVTQAANPNDAAQHGEIVSKVLPAAVTQNENCVICMGPLSDPNETVVAINACTHQFHEQCFNHMMVAQKTKCCPLCKKYFALPEGNMPLGATMTHRVIQGDVQVQLEGGQGYIEIHYNVPGGVQGHGHARPGQSFKGTNRTAYLPNTDKGIKVLRLLQKAFECRLTFTVGDSITSGAHNVVVWNNIHHKTSLTGGPVHFGYPDPEYLDRVTEELRNVGIVEDML